MAPTSHSIQSFPSRAVEANGGPRYRALLYSHDGYGLGHLRRNLVLARAIRRFRSDCSVRILTGSPRALSFDAPPGVEIIKLPPVTKDENGQYVSRSPEIPIEATMRLRKKLVRQAVLEYRPHLLISDHVPTGLRGELLPLLGDLRWRGETILVAGLRDILDDPPKVIASWTQGGVYSLLDSIYHEVWVYGSREIYPIHSEYRMPSSLAQRVRYLGYLGRQPISREPDAPSITSGFQHPSRPHLLCVVGGGEDGFPLARTFLSMLARTPDRWNATLVTGPFLPRHERHLLNARCSALPNAQILRFTLDLERLLAESDALITMGGYNSLVEAVSYGLRVLVIPRIRPRREQWVRALTFQKMGLVHMLEPDNLQPGTLAEATESLLGGSPPRTPEDLGVSWDGARNFAREISQLLQMGRWSDLEIGPRRGSILSAASHS
ncbi:MAG: glycosyltransferase family protein [Planctomycetota bacterium]